MQLVFRGVGCARSAGMRAASGALRPARRRAKRLLDTFFKTSLKLITLTSCFYSKRQIDLPFTIALRGLLSASGACLATTETECRAHDFCKENLRLHAAKIGAGNVIKKRL